MVLKIVVVLIIHVDGTTGLEPLVINERAGCVCDGIEEFFKTPVAATWLKYVGFSNNQRFRYRVMVPNYFL